MKRIGVGRSLASGRRKRAERVAILFVAALFAGLFVLFG
jgi:hypothetical protein